MTSENKKYVTNTVLHSNTINISYILQDLRCGKVSGGKVGSGKVVGGKIKGCKVRGGIVRDRKVR